MGQTPEELYE